jgi:hypothetical protein
MVPIVELFNHENVDVFFDFDYKIDNPFRPKVHYYNKDFNGLETP